MFDAEERKVLGYRYRYLVLTIGRGLTARKRQFYPSFGLIYKCYKPICGSICKVQTFQ